MDTRLRLLTNDDNLDVDNGEMVQGTLKTLPLSPLEKVRTKLMWGSARLGQLAAIELRIEDVATPILLPPINRRYMLGRYDVERLINPDIDLSAYGAAAKGVSRIHAAIEYYDDFVTLEDLSSANGTYLNGHRLSGRRRRVLRDSDEIMLGKLFIVVCFQRRLKDVLAQ